MPMSVVYTTVNGQILCENRGGVVSHFVSDPLGSVVMVRDNSGNTVYEAEYDPYGNVQSETGTNPSEFGYVGTLGYVKDSAFSLYVRARYLLTNRGRWLTKDPLWLSVPGFVYAGAAPSMWADPSGLISYVNCDEVVQGKLNKLCARIKEMTPKQQGAIDKCVLRTSTASSQIFRGSGSALTRCFRRFCANGQIECKPLVTTSGVLYGECDPRTGAVSFNDEVLGGTPLSQEPSGVDD